MREGIVRKFLEASLEPEEEKCSEGARRARAAESRDRNEHADRDRPARVRNRQTRQARQTRDAEATDRARANLTPLQRAQIAHTNAEVGQQNAVRAHEAAQKTYEAARQELRDTHLAAHGGRAVGPVPELIALSARVSKLSQVRTDAFLEREAADRRVREALNQILVERRRENLQRTGGTPTDGNGNTKVPVPTTESTVPTTDDIRALFPSARVSMEGGTDRSWAKSFPNSGADEVLKFAQSVHDAGHRVTDISIENASYIHEHGGAEFRFQHGIEINIACHDGVTIRRTFDPESKTVCHDYLSVPDGVRTGGLGKKILADLLPMYEKNGYKGVEVHANIDVGGYMWARAGFQLNTPSRIATFKSLVESRARQHGFSDYLKDITWDKNAPRTIAMIHQRDSNGKVMMEAGRNGGMEPVSIAKKMLAVSGTHWYGRLDLTDKTNRDQYHSYINGLG
jgi:hypothetical protein